MDTGGSDFEAILLGGRETGRFHRRLLPFIDVGLATVSPTRLLIDRSLESWHQSFRDPFSPFSSVVSPPIPLLCS